ncbi:hypothetical protein [Methanoregula sp.]|uniref:TolB family protein n=1 Tax=Methanoregula sp. TaxID=2052170 RepID=UPI00236BA438|nr:hypothetical protein [Methanoregula sp.]MDD1686912.1 hypothetical protein [Methanoregula sp.]
MAAILSAALICFLLLCSGQAAALTGRDTIIWSPNITLNENSDGYYEFSNFFVLDQDRVVWKNIWSERKVDQPVWTETIYLLNITTGTTRAIARAPDAAHKGTLFPPLSLSRDLVAYTELGANNIFLFNISEGKEYPLTHDGSFDSLDEARENYYPSLDGDRIVWSKKKPYTKGYDYDIVIQNLTTGEQREVCTAKGDQVDPRISGTTVVWTDKRDGSGAGDIYLSDLETGTEKPVCTARGLQSRPDISGNTVVWQDSREGGPAIYMHNMTTGTETRISDQLSVSYGPLIAGNVIAWTEYSALDQRDEPSKWIEVYDLQSGTREHLNVTASSPWLLDLDGNRILYCADNDDKTREEGYLHLFIIDIPEETRVPILPSLTPQTGNQTSPGDTLPSSATTHPAPVTVVVPVIGCTVLVFWIGNTRKR